MQREKLVASLATSSDLSEIMPPVGIFVAMPMGDAPKKWDDERAYFCGPDKVEDLEEELMRCMQKTAKMANQEDYEYWPRVVAVMRSMGLHTALEWLLTYYEI